MTDPIFADPSANSRHRGPNYAREAWLDAVRANPGKWLRLHEPIPSGVASRIRHGQLWGAKPDEFEVTTRRVNEHGERAPGHRTWLYVRTVKP